MVGRVVQLSSYLVVRGNFRGFNQGDSMHIDILKHRKKIDSTFLIGHDLGQNPPEEWDTADLRVLMAFGSTGRTRSVSNSFSSIHNLIKFSYGEQVFIDYSYFPDKNDLEYYRENKIPFSFGNVSRRTMDEYDVIFFSMSIIQEVTNFPQVLKRSFVPVWHNDRINDNKWPLIICGGITVDNIEIMHGGNGGVFDLIAIGQGEGQVQNIINRLLNHKKLFGSTKEKKMDLIKDIVVSSPYTSMYYPNGYEVVYSKDPELMKKLGIETVKPKEEYEWVPAEIHFNLVENLDDWPGFERKIFTPDGSNASSSDIMASAGCTIGGICSFCHEAQAQGTWRERSKPKLMRALHDTKRYGAPNDVSYYSFTLNYISYFMDMIKFTADKVSTMSMINMRADVIAQKPHYFEAAKAMGLNRISMAVEGVGPRVRNEILNKNLPFVLWKEAMRAIFQARFAETKNGMIMTGLETEQDMDAFLDEYTEIVKMKKEMGANTSIRVTFTPLVFYEGVPIQWAPRKTAYMAMEGTKSMGYLIKGLKALGIRSKFNGRGLGTFYQQSVIDLGRQATRTMVDFGDNDAYLFYTDAVPEKKGQAFIDQCLRDIPGLNFKELFLFERPFEWVFNSHVIKRFPEQYAKRLFRDRNKVRPICVKTPASLNAMCSSCGFCGTDKERIFLRTKHDEQNTNTVNDIHAAIYNNKPSNQVRMTIELIPGHEELQKQAMSHIVTSRFLQVDDDLVEPFYKVQVDSFKNLYKDFQKDWMLGTYIFDTQWKDGVNAERLRSLIEQVNERLTVCKVKSVVDVELHSNYKPTDKAIYTFQVPFSSSVLLDGLQNWKGQVKAAAKGMTFMYETKPLRREDFQVYFKPGGNGSYGVIMIPLWVNPYMMLGDLTKKSYWNLLKDEKIVVQQALVMREAGQSSSCQHGPASLVMNSNKVAKLCNNCLAKALAHKMEKAMIQAA